MSETFHFSSVILGALLVLSKAFASGNSIPAQYLSFLNITVTPVALLTGSTGSI